MCNYQDTCVTLSAQSLMLMDALQRRAGKYVMVTMEVSFLGLWYSAMDSCSSYITDWLGIIPLQIATTASVVGFDANIPLYTVKDLTLQTS